MGRNVIGVVRATISEAGNVDNNFFYLRFAYENLFSTLSGHKKSHLAMDFLLFVGMVRLLPRPGRGRELFGVLIKKQKPLFASLIMYFFVYAPVQIKFAVA